MPDLFGKYLLKSLKSCLGRQIFIKKGYLKSQIHTKYNNYDYIILLLEIFLKNFKKYFLR